LFLLILVHGWGKTEKMAEGISQVANFKYNFISRGLGFPFAV
jgi:hypothetical protein